MTRATPNVIPASIQRIRGFLGNQAGMRIEPWASVDETLDAFHDLMASRSRDDAFWQELERLLAQLGADMRARREGSGGSLVDNEVLEPQRQRKLLEEIRGAVAAHRSGRGRFRRLAATLSVPAVGLLVVLGGVMTLGCETKDGEADTAVDPVADTGPGTLDVVSEPDAEEDTVTDTGTDVLEDTTPDMVEDVGCSTSLDEMIDMCIPDETSRTEIQSCLDVLDTSWRSGLTDFLSCESCGAVQYYLETCLFTGFSEPCEDPASMPEFDVDTFVDNCTVPVYLGLRFE